MIEKLDLTVDIEEMERVKAFVLSVSHQADLGEILSQKLHLVVEEAVVNVVNYSAATMMSLCAWQEADSLYISLTDDGTPFDPTQYPSPDLTVPGDQRQVGGLGIHYIRTMSNGMAYRREDGKNILTIQIKVKK